MLPGRLSLRTEWLRLPIVDAHKSLEALEFRAEAFAQTHVLIDVEFVDHRSEKAHCALSQLEHVQSFLFGDMPAHMAAISLLHEEPRCGNLLDACY